MNTSELETVLSWIKTTDLVEVSYRGEAAGFSLTTSEAPSPAIPLPAARFVPVASPAVGAFQWSELGRAKAVEEGQDVAEGALLGVVEAAKGKTVAVKAPCAGRLARALVEAGAPVDFGQPLFFLEAR